MKKLSTLVILLISIVSVHATPKYEAKKKMGEGKFTGQITYLAMGGEMVYALESNGKVHAFDSTSCNRKKSFETHLENTQTLAVNSSGEIYVFSTGTRKEERVSNNRKYTVNVPIGVTCKVFSPAGKELRSLTLDGAQSAKAAKFIGDKLVIADMGQRALLILDPKTGKKSAEIKKGLRLCCGIFDFCEGPENTIAVSNLGAFQLQQYDLEGNLVTAFGKRGKSVDEFQGCCNPVSAGFLSDGSIVTVEKDPTRIKVYNANGKKAQLISGVEELVQGCSYIPVAIDKAGNIFLAAGRKGYIVKCTPQS